MILNAKKIVELFKAETVTPNSFYSRKANRDDAFLWYGTKPETMIRSVDNYSKLVLVVKVDKLGSTLGKPYVRCIQELLNEWLDC